MIINPLESGQEFQPLVQQLNKGLKQEQPQNDKFVDSLKEFVSDVNSFQNDADDLTAKLIKGEPVDIHDVMIATEKAKTSFELLVEIRNKFMDMYQVVSRMQV